MTVTLNRHITLVKTDLGVGGFEGGAWTGTKSLMTKGVKLWRAHAPPGSATGTLLFEIHPFVNCPVICKSKVVNVIN